jgi:ribosome-associated protein
VIQVTPDIRLNEEEIQEVFMRASGPGGQKVNKTSSAVQIRFDVINSPSLPEDVRARLLRIAGQRINKEGVLVIEASRYRSQERNRQDALERLIELVRQATIRPKLRKKTRATQAAKHRRLQAKRRRSEIKRLRRPPHPEERE